MRAAFFWPICIWSDYQQMPTLRKSRLIRQARHDGKHGDLDKTVGCKAVEPVASLLDFIGVIIPTKCQEEITALEKIAALALQQLGITLKR